MWSANDDAGGMISNEEEIFHRIITANGIMPAPAQRISDMGGVGNTGAYASRPSIAYNSTNNDC